MGAAIVMVVLALPVVLVLLPPVVMGIAVVLVVNLGSALWQTLLNAYGPTLFLLPTTQR